MTTIPAGNGQAMAPSLAEAVAAKVAAGARFAGLFGTALPAGPAVTGTTGRPAGHLPSYGTQKARRELALCFFPPTWPLSPPWADPRYRSHQRAGNWANCPLSERR